jgi:hypothetical protein
MREICTSGSVRGAARKSRPYRDYYSGRFSTGLSIPRPDIDRAAHHSGRIQKSEVRIWTAADAEEIGDDKLVALVLRLSMEEGRAGARRRADRRRSRSGLS